jgi:mono/diheme cytochrome c family protein
MAALHGGVSPYPAGRSASERSDFMTRWIAPLLLALLLGGCEKKSDAPVKTAANGNPNRGRAIYLSNCAACHHNDPSRDGTIGPAIKGASSALIEARVMKAAYPPGYTPKRNTAIMPAQSYLEPSIPDLAAFLNQP